METESDKLPRVGFSIGEPGGIGPQLLLQFFQREGWEEAFIPITYAPRRVIEQWRSFLQLSQFRYHLIRSGGQPLSPGSFYLVDTGSPPGDVVLKCSSKVNAQVARKSLQGLIADALSGYLDLVVTLPTDKATLYDAETFPFRGHTDYFRSLPNAKPLMLMVGPRLKVALATEHIPLSAVSTSLSKDLVESVLRQLWQTLRQDFAIPSPRLAVLGLNPHAGDQGLVGTEEEAWLRPLLAQLSQEMLVAGPFAADGFFGAGTYAHFDAVLALYHDQGLIPFKLLEGWSGYQYTAGLPFVRTAPDHGTAYDQVGEPTASMESLSAAIWEGLLIAQRRSGYHALS